MFYSSSRVQGALLPSKHARAFFLLGSGRCSGHMLAAEAGEPPFSAEVERRRVEADAGMEPLPLAGRFIICKSFEADVRGGAHAALRSSSLLFREIGKRQFSTIRALYTRFNLHGNTTANWARLFSRRMRNAARTQPCLSPNSRGKQRHQPTVVQDRRYIRFS